MCLCFKKKYKNDELSVCFLDNQYMNIDKELLKLYEKRRLIIINDNYRYKEYLSETPVFSLLVERINEYMVSDLLNAYMKDRMVGLLRICLLWYVIVIMEGVKSDIRFLTCTNTKCSICVKLNNELLYITLEME